MMNPRWDIGVDAAGRFRIAGDKPNARKAYSLVLFELVLLRPRVRACELPTVNSFTVARGVVAGGQMSAIEAVVITILGTAAAVVWALCLEAWRKKRAGHGREPGPG